MRSPLLLLCILFALILPIFAGDYPSSLIRGRIFQGRYEATQPGSTFNFLQGRQGIIKVILYDYTDGDIINSADIILRDPKYSDSKVVSIQINQVVHFNNDTWSSDFHTITYNTIEHHLIEDTETMIKVQTKIQLFNLESEDYEAVKMSIHMKGQTFEFSADLEHLNNTWQTIAYCLYIACIAGVQLYSASKLTAMLDAPNFVAAGKMSLVTFSCCAIVDMTHGFQIAQLIFGPYANQAFYLHDLFFALPAALYLISYIMYNMRLVLFVWRSQNMHLIGQINVLKRRLLTFYCIYTFGLIIYMVSIFFVSCLEWYIILSQLLLLPQIIKNIWKGHKTNFNSYYIFGFVGVRMLLPIYERSCPGNLFALTPNYTVVMTLLIIFVVEVSLLYLQARFGARFFVPKRLQPDFFDYKCELILSQDTKDNDCSVCLLNLFEVGSNQSQNNSSLGANLLEPSLKEKVTVAKTPCSHYFHQECLSEWLEVKLECPTCRRQLPPIY